MPFSGRVIFSCPRRGTVVKRFRGSSGQVVAQMFKPGLANQLGPGCTIVKREIDRTGAKPKRKKRR